MGGFPPRGRSPLVVLLGDGGEPARPASLEGLTVGLLDISKARGDTFLDELESMLSGRGLAVKRYKKPTFARVAPVDLQHQIATECNVVIEALAD